jgi:hypothetical protein
MLAPVDVIVPTLELPPAIPFTCHAMTAPGAMQSEAVNVWDAPTVTLADAGEIAFTAAHEIVTVAVALFDGSATLVATTETGPCGGGLAGAVYTAASAPLALIAPRPAPLSFVLTTLQLTAALALPAPLTVALNVTFPPGATLAEFGVMLTAMLTATPL